LSVLVVGSVIHYIGSNFNQINLVFLSHFLDFVAHLIQSSSSLPSPAPSASLLSSDYIVDDEQEYERASSSSSRMQGSKCRNCSRLSLALPVVCSNDKHGLNAFCDQCWKIPSSCPDCGVPLPAPVEMRALYQKTDEARVSDHPDFHASKGALPKAIANELKKPLPFSLITEDGLRRLEKSLPLPWDLPSDPTLPSLCSEVSFHNCPTGSQWTQILDRVASGKIECLNLQRCGLLGAHVMDLVGALKIRRPVLRVLDLSFNSIDNRGAASLLLYLAQEYAQTPLRYVSLTGNDLVSPQLATAISDQLKSIHIFVTSHLEDQDHLRERFGKVLQNALLLEASLALN